MIAKWIAWFCGKFFLSDYRPLVFPAVLGLCFLFGGCHTSSDTPYRALSSKNAVIIGEAVADSFSVADSLLGHFFPAWRADRRLLTVAGLAGEQNWLTGLQYLPNQGWLPTFVAPWRHSRPLDQYHPEQPWEQFSTFKGTPVFHWREELFAATTGGFLIVGRLPLLVEDAIRELAGGTANLSADRSFRRQWHKKTGKGRRLFLRLNDFPDIRTEAAAWLRDYEWLDLYLAEAEDRCLIEGEALPVTQRVVNAISRGREPGWALPFLPGNITFLRWTHTPASVLPEPYREYFERWWNGELTIFRFDGQPLPVFVFRSTAVERTVADLDQLAGRQGILDTESYQLFQIRQILDDELLASWATTAVRNPYFTVIGDYAVFSASLSALTVSIDFFLAGRPPVLPSALPEIADSGASGLQWFRPDLFLENRLPPLEIAWSERPVDERLHLRGIGRLAAEDLPGASLWWKYSLDEDVVAGPAAVRNAAGELVALLVQDAGGVLYCLDAKGALQWRLSVAGKIESDFKIFNGRAGTHIFFNTAGKIYGLDVSGSSLDHFPIELPARAAAGLQAVDFDRNGQASLLIPTLGAAVYGYDQAGNLLPGWNPLRDTLPLRFPLIHLQENYRDLLLGVNVADRILCWNRAGEPALPGLQLDTLCPGPPQLLSRPSPRILAIDASGRGFVLSASGGWTSFPLPGRGQRWLTANLRGDERPEWLALKGRVVEGYNKSDANFQKIFQHQFDHPQDTIFVLSENLAQRSLIGALDRQRRQLRVLDGAGRPVTRGFLAGDRPAVLMVQTADHFALATALDKDLMVYGVAY